MTLGKESERTHLEWQKYWLKWYEFHYLAQTIILTGVKKGDSFKNIILIKILLFILWIPKPFFFMTYVYCWEKIAVGHSSDWKSFNPFTAKCGQRQNSIKNPKFHFVKFWKTSSSTMWKYRLRGFIDWLQHRILSTDSKVRATFNTKLHYSLWG